MGRRAAKSANFKYTYLRVAHRLEQTMTIRVFIDQWQAVSYGVPLQVGREDAWFLERKVLDFSDVVAAGDHESALTVDFVED